MLRGGRTGFAQAKEFILKAPAKGSILMSWLEIATTS